MFIYQINSVVPTCRVAQSLAARPRLKGSLRPCLFFKYLCQTCYRVQSIQFQVPSSCVSVSFYQGTSIQTEKTYELKTARNRGLFYMCAGKRQMVPDSAISQDRILCRCFIKIINSIIINQLFLMNTHPFGLVFIFDYFHFVCVSVWIKVP